MRRRAATRAILARRAACAPNASVSANCGNWPSGPRATTKPSGEPTAICRRAIASCAACCSAYRRRRARAPKNQITRAVIRSRNPRRRGVFRNLIWASRRARGRQPQHSPANATWRLAPLPDGSRSFPSSISPLYCFRWCFSSKVGEFFRAQNRAPVPKNTKGKHGPEM